MSEGLDSVVQDSSYNSVLKDLRKDSRSIRNRLLSILLDAEWVQEAAKAYARPLVPNERCGSWYVEQYTDSCYFKSTDGHTNQWSLSTKRTNFHLLKLIADNAGVVLVDSTRRGKTMPDSFTKTVPIWCAVLNYVMFGGDGPFGDVSWFFYPHNLVSKNEASSIVRLIPSFASSLLELNLISKQELLDKFHGKYLRPLWVYPELSLPLEPPVYEDFYPVILCNASFKSQDGISQLDQFLYVQGAADDHELWAPRNLTPQLFWNNRHFFNSERLRSCDDADILQFTSTSLRELDFHEQDVVDIATIGSSLLSVGKIVGNVGSNSHGLDYDLIISLSSRFTISESVKNSFSYKLSCNKKGSNELRKHLPDIVARIQACVSQDKTVLVLCECGQDLAVGVALIVLATNYDLSLCHKKADNLVTKEFIKRLFGALLKCKKANPSRATLQSVNSYLM